eukprot:2863359-Prorocentrum_lima.AAC.1
MTSSLVGSEMCIRDSARTGLPEVLLAIVGLAGEGDTVEDHVAPAPLDGAFSILPVGGKVHGGDAR